MKRHALLKALWEGVFLIGTAMGAASQNTARPVPIQDPVYVPNACLGEIHANDSDQALEVQFLKDYKEKYGKGGRTLILSVEGPKEWQAAAEIYFRSKRSPQDELVFWMAADQAQYPYDSEAIHKRTAHLFMTERGENARAGVAVAAQAYSLGYRVQFVDEWTGGRYESISTPEKMKYRNETMGRRDAVLALTNKGGLVAINGVFHNAERQDGAGTVVGNMAKYGVSCASFNFSSIPATGQRQVTSSREIMDALSAADRFRLLRADSQSGRQPDWGRAH